MKRKPLSKNARRAGWIGCNIDIRKVPENSRIFFVRNSEIISKEKVQIKWERTNFLKTQKREKKGWILDIMSCIDAIQKDTFSLKDVYLFETILKEKYPNNNFIKDKIRQQLQFLRDIGIVEFKNRGIYKKVRL